MVLEVRIKNLKQQPISYICKLSGVTFIRNESFWQWVCTPRRSQIHVQFCSVYQTLPHAYVYTQSVDLEDYNLPGPLMTSTLLKCHKSAVNYIRKQNVKMCHSKVVM